MTNQPPEIYTVSELNREVRCILEGSFGTLQVEGEISNFVAPQSGHWYFSLKDSSAQIRCAMFRPLNRQVRFAPQDGMHIVIKGRVSLYEGRGDFQLIAEAMEEAGVGKLQKAFEALKKRLLEAGLFDPIHKKKLPSLPKAIGVITSATGAAVRDILTVLKRRSPHTPIIIYPTLVQGELAAANIVQMIQTANRRNECEVLILARGGGSLEDLWPFNEEIVAHAIHQSNLPIITGVGHEIDFTIADFVADLRAPTPSAAAELATLDKEETLSSLQHYRQHLLRLTKQSLQQRQHQLDWMTKHLQQQHPKQRLRERSQQLDLLEMALVRAQTKRQHDSYIKLTSLAAKLDALSPLSTLQRGYAIATRLKDQHILRNVKEVSIGDKVGIKLASGNLVCTVSETAK